MGININATLHNPVVRPINWMYNQSMGRPSKREARRRELTLAFARVLAAHGQAGASIAAVAEEAGVAPGLVHHHFASKQDLYGSLLELLIGGFHQRIAARAGGADSSLADYTDAALALDASADLVAARAWTGLFAEALSDRLLFEKVRRLLDTEVAVVERRGRGRLTAQDASAVLAYIIGALVFGAFAPRKAAGFAAPAARKLLAGLASVK